MSEREKIAARIRALRAKTVENSCTEEEALAAAEMLARLLEKYNLTLDEAELRASPFEQFAARYSGPVAARLWKIADAAAYLTGARYWQTERLDFTQMNFFGFAHEVAVAQYILEICANAMEREQARYQQSIRLLIPRKQARLLTAFLDGMADHLWARIRKMKPSRPPGTGLVVVHDDLLAQAMKDAGIETRSCHANRSRMASAGYEAGKSVANGVALNRGVGGRDSGLRLA